jgi:hypothetical protein
MTWGGDFEKHFALVCLAPPHPGLLLHFMEEKVMIGRFGEKTVSDVRFEAV